MSTILLPLPSVYTLRPFVRPSVHSFKLTCRYQMMLVFGVLWQPLGETVNIWLLPLDQCGRVYSSSSCETLGRLVGSSFVFDLELRTFGWFARWSVLVLPKGSRSVCVYVCVCHALELLLSFGSLYCFYVNFLLSGNGRNTSLEVAFVRRMFAPRGLFFCVVLKWIKTSEWMNEYPPIAAQEKFTVIFYVKNKRKCVQIQKQEQQQRETSNKIKKQN